MEAWIGANTDAQETAARVGVSRNTVRARLRAAEHLLNRDLLTTGSGIHDLVHALHIDDQRPADPTSDPACASPPADDIASPPRESAP